MTESESDKLAVVEQLIKAFNDLDMDMLSKICADDIVFSHKNKGMEGHGKDHLLSNIKMMSESFPGRTIGATKRYAVNGDVVIREAYWTGTASTDVEGFAKAGETAYLDTATLLVIRDGKIHEWSDFG